MPLTIPELARAVGKSENYVRQHIFRKHLAVQKDGRNISVTLDEALRWARERQLPFELPANARELTPAMENRTARMTVLTLHRPEMKPCNLLTVVRHRRQDALGPWSNEPGETWTNENLGNGLRLYSLEAPLNHCRTLVDGIRDAATLTIHGEQIDYALERIPRRHWAFRDERGHADASMISPFSRHSAEIVEYWSLAAEPRKHWLELLNSRRGQMPLSRLGVPLDRLSDRVGNIMIVGAEDEIACDLWVGHDGTLRLLVEADALPPSAYRATVWASHAGDEVLRREVPVATRLTPIRLATDVDRIGFEVFRTADGQCLDLMEAPWHMGIGGQLKINSSSTLQFRDRQGRPFHQVNLPGPSVRIDAAFDEESSELDKEIRQQWLDRRVRVREATVRKERNFARFQPSELENAVNYLIAILRQDADQKTPIYFADPYFVPSRASDAQTNLSLKKASLDIFAITVGTPLRILCGKTNKPKLDDPPPWWSTCPEQITAHVRVRSFCKQNGKAGFHDRFLITPKREIMISNSINGWHNHGVTFATLPYDVYGTEADRLWNMDIGSTTAELLVREIGR